jgi:squalene-hopene/tetraprenyl-beta-curcumene cyclase
MNVALGAAEGAAKGVASQIDRRALIAERAERLFGMQKPDGHIVFDLEADTTIPAEYVLLRHFLGEVDRETERRIGLYLRAEQNPDGSWPLFKAGAGDISATIKAYWALKIIGDDVNAPHMARARAFVLAKGGAAKANVFTRIALALFGLIPWRGVPVIPVEVMHLPLWFPFHISKVAYWSRTVMIPLLVLCARKARAANPTGTRLDELFVVPVEQQKVWQINPNGSLVGECFLVLDKVLRSAEPLIPGFLRRSAIAKAEAFVLAHLNGEDGLGAIYPAMANAVMMFRTLGYPDDHPAMVTARRAIERLKVERGDQIWFQPCVSPVWDTGLSAHALLESGHRDDPRLVAMLDWLKDKQILDHKGDWQVRRPDVRPGGWAFQYANPDYPDVDDTAVVAMAMHRQGDPKYAEAIDRACEWIVGMQSSNGGWGAFEPENEHFYLNAIPFADHGALLDPPTVDVTARCIGLLAQVDAARYAEPIARAVRWVRGQQEADGSWFGRWGANYVYGTWSVLVALKAAGVDMGAPWVRKAVDWLKAQQRADGGWGEGLETYEPGVRGHAISSTASQTAWALLGLMSAGELDSEEVARGVRWLEEAPREDGPRWEEALYTGTGFPKVFYLKYHGYAAFFPLWAVARYQALRDSNSRDVAWGM